MALLDVEGIETYYGNIKALKGVSLTVEEGEIVTLIGSNGAGKSTTLRTISGLSPARKGVVRFDGKDITALPATSGRTCAATRPASARTWTGSSTCSRA